MSFCSHFYKSSPVPLVTVKRPPKGSRPIMFKRHAIRHSTPARTVLGLAEATNRAARPWRRRVFGREAE